MLTAKDERLKVTTYTVDGSGRTTGMQTPTGVDSFFEYNPTTGLLERVKDDLARVVHEFVYDTYRRLWKSRTGLAEETVLAYDNQGNVNQVTDALFVLLVVGERNAEDRT